MIKRFYTIQEAAKLLNVSTKTLRRWDERGILVAQRTAGNQRRYTVVQIEAFQNSRNLISKEPLIPSSIHPLTSPQYPRQNLTERRLPETQEEQKSSIQPAPHMIPSSLLEPEQ